MAIIVLVGVGFTGADFVADVRDIAYDIDNWEWAPSHYGKFGLDLLAFLPAAGIFIKYTDEIADLIKTRKYVTRLECPTDVAKAVSKSVDDILPGKTLTNQTKRVTNYVSDTTGQQAALEDFYALNPHDVRTYPDGTIAGILEDGRKVNVHSSSSLDGTPTLEIQDPNTGSKVKIRY